MLTTLRRRFILSHMLPLLVIVPMIGIALIYLLETRVLMNILSRELMGQALLAAEIASDREDIWADPADARAFVSRIDAEVQAQVMLLDSNARLLASSEPADADRLGQRIELADWADALAGKTSLRTVYDRNPHREVVDILVPVVGSDQQIVGILRLSQRLTKVYEQSLRLRYVIASVLLGGLVLGAVLGWMLAISLEQPLRWVTQAVYHLVNGEELVPLPEQGPREIRLLLHSINSLVKRLHDVERARRQLLANLVHELGRPLGALRSAVQALQGGAYREAALRQELLVGMEEEMGRLQRMLDDLAGLYDRVLGTLELNRRPTSLSEWIAHVVGPWREAAQAKGLHWQADIPAALPTVEIDADRLAQALGNLLSNATKFTPPGGAVSISAHADEEAMWIRVSDTGPGIAPEEQDRIFTPFYRGHAERRFAGGMGLGLSIARDLVVAHGGQLEVQSTPGQGSRFTLWLPLSPQ